MYMRAKANNGRVELLVSDGTDTGTHIVPFAGADFSAGDPVTEKYLTMPLTVVGNKLFFWNTYINSTGHALYVIDLTSLAVNGGTEDRSILTVFPNPARNEMHITAPAGTRLYKVELQGIDGRMVASIPVNGSVTATIRLDEYACDAFMILKAYTSDGIVTQKIEYRH